MTTPSIVYGNRRRVAQKNGQSLRLADNLRFRAARVNRSCLTKKGRAYAPFMSAKKVSQAINAGGALGDVLIQMQAMTNAGQDPASIQRIAACVQGHADALTEQAACLESLNRDAIERNGTDSLRTYEWLERGCDESRNNLRDAIKHDIATDRLRLLALAREDV